MFQTFIKKCKSIFTNRDLVIRIVFILAILIVFRALTAIPVPGVNAGELASFLTNNQFLGFLNIFSGGGLTSLSIVLLGVGPFITASIIMQLLTLMSPKLKELYQESGEMGRRTFNQYSRYVTVILAIIQGTALLAVLAGKGIVPGFPSEQFFINIAIVVAGSFLMMWLGELISEFGVGNGVSIIIFAGIVARIPNDVNQALFSYDPSQLPLYIGFAILAVLIVAAVVMITEAERLVPVTYAKQQARQGYVTTTTSSHIPLRMNQAGVMPIIFALSLLTFPKLIASAMAASTAHHVVAAVGIAVTTFLANNLYYGILYFILVFVFTYFYTAVTFDADAMATNLQKSGAFIPNVRPGTPTAEFVGTIMTRITFFGGLFLAIVAVMPTVFQGITGNQNLAIGGTALLIVVSVIIDLLKKLSAQASMSEY
jgi:preprotein translocase subunit SecY